MINYYQPDITPFLRDKQYKIPEGIKQLYYHSWEDALWEILREKQIPPGSTLLFPDFYCIDVLENVTRHGYRWQLYPLDQHFQINQKIFIERIAQTHPSMIVIFHACGITSELLKKTEWIEKINQETLIIEDCVHRLVNPENVTTLNNNHIIMDSLRKVSPIPGSCVYGSYETLPYTPQKKASHYTVSSTITFHSFKKVLSLAHRLNSAKLANWSHAVLLKAHDNIIGNSWKSYAGSEKNLLLHTYFDFEKIEKLKKAQVEEYETALEKIYSSSFFYKIHIAEEDYKNLHVYPVGIMSDETESLLSFLENNNIGCLDKFPDCPWSKNRGVLFFPLGFHITDKEILIIGDTLHKWLKSIQ